MPTVITDATVESGKFLKKINGFANAWRGGYFYAVHPGNILLQIILILPFNYNEQFSRKKMQSQNDKKLVTNSFRKWVNQYRVVQEDDSEILCR